MINYPVQYNKENGSIDDCFGHVLAIVNWAGRSRSTTQEYVDKSSIELVDLINSGRINLNMEQAVKEDPVRFKNIVDTQSGTPIENSGSIKKAINFVRKKFLNERGEVVEAKGRPKKNWKPLNDKEVKELENANI